VIDILKTLSPEDLAKVETASPELIDWCLQKGRLEARLMFPRAGENVVQLEHEYRDWLRDHPKPPMGAR
jgi:hypothetical protein